LKHKAAPLVLLLDEGTAKHSAAPFIDSGHQVIYHADVLSAGSKDDIVAATAIFNNACLLAVDKDMK
jgi:predicted nuclease of predicted toxin-antitoxin system